MTGARVRKRPWLWGKAEMLSGLTALAQQQQEQRQRQQQQQGRLQQQATNAATSAPEGDVSRSLEGSSAAGAAACAEHSDAGRVGCTSVLGSVGSSVDDSDADSGDERNGREPDSDVEGSTSSSNSNSSGAATADKLSSGGSGGNDTGSTAIPKENFIAVEAQLQLLGSAHVGFSSLPVPGHAVSVVGARPFSKVRRLPG